MIKKDKTYLLKSKNGSKRKHLLKIRLKMDQKRLNYLTKTKRNIRKSLSLKF